MLIEVLSHALVVCPPRPLQSVHPWGSQALGKRHDKSSAQGSVFGGRTVRYAEVEAQCWALRYSPLEHLLLRPQYRHDFPLARMCFMVRTI